MRYLTLHSAQLIRILILFSLTLTNFSLGSDDPIGDIVDRNGVASLIRESGEKLSVSDNNIPDIKLLDTAVTGNGRMLIQFLDEEELSIIEHTKVYIDKVYYDPNPSKSKMSIRMAQGTARFTSGRGKRINKANIDLSTPTAQIAVLGTDFTTTIDEIGRSLIILLPDEKTGESSGKIMITNNGGSVTLDEPYQASVVTSFESPPTKPVALSGINTSMISNVFIISEPREIKKVKEQEGLSSENDRDNILDVDFLEFDELEKDYFEEDELEFTELDIDYLDVDFLQDILDIVIELDRKSALEKDSLNNNIALAGTVLGFDIDTQYNTIIDRGLGTIKFYRNVDGIISVTLMMYQNATLRTISDQKESNIILGDGQGIIITITQVN